MARQQGAVRIGPISILVLITILCLSVMAVLTLVTADAEETITNRQVESTTAFYANETEAEEFLAQLDNALAQARSSNGSVASALDTLSLPDGATYEQGILTASFVQDSGRRLDIELSIPSVAGYEIVAWRSSTEWNEDDPDKIFWSAPE